MDFKIFCDYLSQLEETSSRIEITKILSTLISSLNPEEVRVASYLLTGSIAPTYESRVFNVAEKMLLRAVSESFEVSQEILLQEYKKKGDIGLLAYELAAKHAPSSKTHSLTSVFENLRSLTEEEGEGSQEKRIAIITTFLKSSSAHEAKYYVRIISGNLRLGFSEKTMVDALSWSETGSKEKSKQIMKSFDIVPDIGALAEKIRKEGVDKATKNMAPILGIPVQPMLCQRIKSPAEMIKKMGVVSVEPKFDGLRVLIHYSKEKHVLKAFTRNLKDISDMFPELQKIGEHIHAKEIILDSEVVGMDSKLMKILDFQTTMQRRRKHDIEETQNKIPVTFQVFDILYKDGESLMHEKYEKRREILSKTVINGTLLKVDQNTVTDDPSKIAALHEQYRGQGLEGIIVKKLDSEYVAGRLGYRWVKMKEAESATGKLSDTVDAVIMGYSSGQGKRAGFGIGQFLAGVIDGKEIKTVTKVGTGLSDDQFKELNTLLSSIKVEEKPAEYEVTKNLLPDYWVKPRVVVEIAADDITVSPNHTAGYAMRFPRLVKIRGDKNPSQATTLKEFKKLFELQKK